MRGNRIQNRGLLVAFRGLFHDTLLNGGGCGDWSMRRGERDVFGIKGRESGWISDNWRR